MDGNYAGISRRFGELWHHLLHGNVHRCGCTHPSVTPKNTGLVGHRSVPCSFCPNLGHSKGGLPTPLPGMTWIPGPGFCFGRLLSAHFVCLYVPYRLFCCPGGTSIKPRSASMGIRQSHPGARSPRSACLIVLPASSACNSRRARARLFRTIALKTRRNSGRQLRHNANAVL